ncbi:hypothetical protein JCM10049v2_007526 [Rhodotorula toruloides]
MNDLVEEAQVAGEAPPTVETFLRRVAYPFETLPFPQDRYSPWHDALCDGMDRSARPQTVLGLCYLPELASVLSEAGLSYLLSRALHPPDTLLSSVLSTLPEERLRQPRPLSGVSSIQNLRVRLPGFCPGLVPPEAARRLELAYSRWDCDCESKGQASHSCGVSPVRLGWHHQPADDVLDLLEGLAEASAATGSSSHPWQCRPILEATNPWTRLDELAQTGKDCRPLLVTVLGETHFTPLLVLDVNSSSFPSFSQLGPAHNPQLSDLIADSKEAKTVLARLTSPSHPTETKTNSMRGTSPLLIVFGPKLPVNAALQEDGASFIHTIYGAGNEEVEGKIRTRVSSLLAGDKAVSLPEARAPVEANERSAEHVRLPRAPSLQQEYRLVTFEQLKKNRAFHAAFVCPDGSLATLHSLSPLPPASSPPASPTPVTPSPSGQASHPTTRTNGVHGPPDAPKPLLLLGADKLGEGNQGFVYRAHCSNSPFPLLAKYSRCGTSSNTKVAREAAFFREHGEKMVEEELAPRFVGAWSAEEGEASPYKMGGAMTMLLMEEWGRSVQDWSHLSSAERHAVRKLAVRFHLKLEACHCSLRADNVVWKREIGASSFRLIDFARSDDGDCVCREDRLCCEELTTLAKSLAWADMVEMVAEERERLEVAEALAVVGLWSELNVLEHNRACRSDAIRFHFKLGCQHKSLRDDNIVWKPDVGPSSFRLIDFARSNDDCSCLHGELCEELFELEEALHQVDHFEVLKARREEERIDQALVAVGEVERELRDQARREAELAA